MIISCNKCYHGNTLGALSVSSFESRQEPYKDILMKNVEHVSSNYPYRQQMEGESNEDFVARKVDELEQTIQGLGPKNVMCFIVEPHSGSTLGCVPAVPGYLKAMQDVCHKYDIIFILDEVMCGVGRTGPLYVGLSQGVVPDILIIGKGLGAGYFPVSAVLAHPDVWKALDPQFIHGLTHDGNPVAAVVAIKSLEIIQKLLPNVSKQGAYLEKNLKAALTDHPNVGDIRGDGLFWGIEFVKDKITKEPFDPKQGVSEKIVALARSPEFNLLIYPGKGCVDGYRGDHIIIMPPFTVTEQDIEFIVEVVLKVINRVLNEIDKND